jgi:hypothetical protein
LVVVRGEHTRWQASNITVGGESRRSFGARSDLEIIDGATVSIGGTGSQAFSILNSGRVRLDRGTLAGSSQKTFSSSGILEGDGAVNVDLFSNRGSISIGEQQKLTFSSRITNEGFGRVEILGGELEAGATLTNLAGANLQMENATLRIRGESALINSGNITLAGVNRVYGGIFTRNDSTGIISFAADSQTTFFGRVENNGQLKSSSGAHVRFTSLLDGNGVSGPGTVQFDAMVQPGRGFAAQSMDFGGDVRFGDASGLSIDIRGTTPGTEFDELNIAGQASLNGALSLLVRDPLSAPATLTILRADELVGTFSSVPTLGANLGGGILFNGITYDYDQDAVRVSLVPAAAADFNTDGSVDGADLLAWQQQLGDAPFFGSADGNDDGAIDAGDLALWQQGFAPNGNGPSPAGAAVPEPGAAALLLVGLLGLGGRRVALRRALRL